MEFVREKGILRRRLRHSIEPATPDVLDTMPNLSKGTSITQECSMLRSRLSLDAQGL